MGEIFKTVDLTPFNVDPDPFAQDTAFEPAYANDILYGGLGNDFMHGGAGDDAMSGAEALAAFFDAPVNPGNVLGFNAERVEFADYDEEFPRREIPGFLLNFEVIADTNSTNDT